MSLPFGDAKLDAVQHSQAAAARRALRFGGMLEAFRDCHHLLWPSDR
jgi:hypothetical protein